MAKPISDSVKADYKAGEKDWPANYADEHRRQAEQARQAAKHLHAVGEFAESRRYSIAAERLDKVAFWIEDSAD